MHTGISIEWENSREKEEPTKKIQRAKEKSEKKGNMNFPRGLGSSECFFAQRDNKEVSAMKWHIYLALIERENFWGATKISPSVFTLRPFDTWSLFHRLLFHSVIEKLCWLKILSISLRIKVNFGGFDLDSKPMRISKYKCDPLSD